MLEEDAIARLSLRDRREYRKFVFPESVADPTHDPFFSLEHASSWITSRGLQLFLSWDDSELHAFDVELIPGDELMDYRSEILPDTYIAHPFFSLDNAATWSCSLCRELGSVSSRSPSALNVDKVVKGQLVALKGTLKGNELKKAETALNKEVKQELSARRAWLARRSDIDEALDELRKGDLRGVRIQGRRPTDRIEASDSGGNSEEPSQSEASRVVISERDSVEDINQNSGAEAFDPAEVAAILQEIQEFEQEFEQNLSANPSFELDPELEPNYFPIERYVPAPARTFNNDLPRLNLPPPDSPPAMDTDPDTFATSRQSGKRSRGPDVGAELNPSNGSEGRPKRTLRPTKKARGLAHDEKSEEEA
ncbi:hypothetical protein C8F01DRAFT_1254332 [Mycena amicta]|nr:hypothetical protein C8F01DRAFT_1254332 [Mycena amicta]